MERSFKDLSVYSSLDMYLKLKETEQEIIQGLMCIFLLRYVLKAKGNGPRDPSRTYVYVCILLTKQH